MSTRATLSRDRTEDRPDLPVRDVLGIPIHAITMEQSLDVIEDAIRTRRQLQIGVVNAAKILGMRKNPMLRDDVLSSDLILADGMSVVWAGRVLGSRLPERVAGIDLMMNILKRGNERGWRVFLLGATQEVLQTVREKIAEQFPQVQVAGAHDGYFKESEEEQIAAEIAASKPDVIFIAITSPKKERFLGRWSRIIGVPVCHGVGGSFDVVAGKVKRAPESWQRLGLEWFYRFKQEPGRLWKRYLVTNTQFCLLVGGQLVRGLIRK